MRRIKREENREEVIEINEDTPIIGTEFILEKGDKIKVVRESEAYRTRKGLVFAPFGKYDWDGYAGAERFPDGSDPLIASTDKGEFIADPNAIQFMDFVDMGNTYSYNWKKQPQSQREAFMMIENLMKDIGPDFTISELEEIGFDSILY